MELKEIAKKELLNSVLFLNNNIEKINEKIEKIIKINQIDILDLKSWEMGISKISTFMSYIIEFCIIYMLNDSLINKDLFVWKRKEKEFPDAQLIFKHSEENSNMGIEIKVISCYAEEASARYRHSANLLNFGEIYLSIFSWKIISEKPFIKDVLIIESRELAESRDKSYYNPPKRILVQPNNTKQGNNNKQTEVKYYTWQKSQSEEKEKEAESLTEKWKNENKDKKTPWEQNSLNEKLKQKYNYRSDNNFGKLQRINHPKLKEFLKNIKNSVK